MQIRPQSRIGRWVGTLRSVSAFLLAALAPALSPALLAALLAAPGALAAQAPEGPSSSPPSLPEIRLPEIRIVQPDPAEPASAPEGHLVVQWEPIGDPASSRNDDDGSSDPPAGRGASEPGTSELGTYDYELRLSSLSDDPDAPLDLQTLFVGDDRASFVSGLPNGPIQIQVRAVGGNGRTGAWSAPLRVEVDYPSPRTVVILMSLGALLLVATVSVIVLGHRRTAIDGEEPR